MPRPLICRPETWRDGTFTFNDYLIESIQVGTIEVIDDEDET